MEGSFLGLFFSHKSSTYTQVNMVVFEIIVLGNSIVKNKFLVITSVDTHV